MRVTVERSGGIAGIRKSSSVSTDQLAPEAAQRLSDLVKSAGFHELAPVIRSAQPGADRFQYKITVESENGSHTVLVDEGAMPPSLQLLLNWIKDSARTRASG